MLWQINLSIMMILKTIKEHMIKEEDGKSF